MKFLFIALLALISNTFAFNYDRMLTRQGYSNQGDEYYSRFDDRFVEYGTFYYSECLVKSDTLFCRQLDVNCNKYTLVVRDAELYLNGVKQSFNKIIEVSHEISPGEYRIWGMYYSISGFLGMIEWKPNAIEADSYEDKICSENNQ